VSRSARGCAILLLLVTFAQGCGDTAATAATGGERLRIVTLAPHLAELVHAAGAGSSLVGVSAYSDYPQTVSDLPQVGDAFAVDQERLALLKPDLVLAWASGTPLRNVEELRKRGYRVEIVATQRLADIAAALRQIGALAGRPEQAGRRAERFSESLAELREEHADKAAIRVFYQISTRPLYTASGEHYVSELIDLCGGQNVFADLGALAPLVSEEAVLARNPEVFIAGSASVADNRDELFGQWRRWPELAANRYDNFFTLNADRLTRATPRIVEAGQELCDRLQAARDRRTAALARD